MIRARVWSETLPLAHVAEPAVMELLAQYGIELLLAVRPGDEAGARAVTTAARAHGVYVGLWPMLDDARGRWASAGNVDAFVALVERFAHETAPDEIAIDLEPPIGAVSRWTGARRIGGGSVAAGDRDRARAVLARCTDALHARGIRVSAAVLPLVVFDRAREATVRGWQRLLGVPCDGIAWDHVSVMAYSSMLEHWSHGLFDRDAAVSLLDAFARRARARYGSAVAGVSLGAVGTGALGDEPVYRSPDELAHDVAVVRAAGIDTLTLFDLGGVLARPPARAWLDALTSPSSPVRIPPHSRRVRSLLALAGAGARLLGA